MAEQLYIKYDQDGTPMAYAYGEHWVAMALYMDDISHATPEEAKEAWEKWKDEQRRMKHEVCCCYKTRR